MLNKILISFIAVINLHKLFPNHRNRGAFIFFVLGLPLLPLLVRIKTLNDDTFKLVFLIHIVFFFVFNYLSVWWVRKKSTVLKQNVIIVQTIHAGIHYLIFKGYQLLFI